MSTKQFQALVQQVKELSAEERRQLVQYLSESELPGHGSSGEPGKQSRSATNYVAFFGSGRGAFATSDEADAFIRQERDAWEN
jgi:hypothetical protein